jgi:tRNA-modifying protein YgfZ
MSNNDPFPDIAATPLGDDDVAAYHALRTDAVWWDSFIHWSTFRGDKAAEALNGLVTNDVAALSPGEGLHAAALSPKGKLITDMLIVRLDETALLIATMPGVAPAWMDLARKYVNPRLCKVADETDRYQSWMVYGAQAPSAIAAIGRSSALDDTARSGMIGALNDWPTWRHGLWNLGRTSVRLIRAPIMGAVPGFIILADVADAPAVQQGLSSAPFMKGSGSVWNVARIEAGRPVIGVDMDENTIPQEANLDALGAISFTKGCYTGQETVARVHFRGHVNRHLRGLIGDAPMAAGASVTDAGGKVVGDVRSAVISPSRGPIAMAMVRREVEIGATVLLDGIIARVVPLPFPAE